ncbi:MAG: dihydropteroate synthase [Ilumatobacteraceae bacterium]
MSIAREPTGLPARLSGLGRCLVMGVVNVTPDSFSDGGRFLDVERAVRHGLEQHAQGADIVDIGGESTRPGAERVPADVEQSRVLPVIATLADAGVPVSIDTMRASTAVLAVDAGATIVNDVSAGLADPEMLSAMADVSVPYVAMHWRGSSEHMDALAVYDDVVSEVRHELRLRVEACVDAGVDRGRVVLDPGLGFAKTPDHNWALLQRIADLDALDQPLLIGASRKRFLGSLLSDPITQEPRPVAERDAATGALSALAAASGVWAVRVHDVRSTRDAIEVARAWRDGRG